jgi:peptidoglycan hydrolase CwlO-like protein
VNPPPWIVPLLVGQSAPVLLYLSAARRLSGRIATTDASKLWDEANQIREDYRARIKELNEVIGRCEARIDSLETRNDMLAKENNNLQNVIGKLEKELRLTADVNVGS